MSMPPMPPGGMPPPWPWSSSFGASAIMTSVVSSRPETEAAFCRARRVTLVGSRMPASEHVAVLARRSVVAVRALARLDGVQDDSGVFTRVLDDLAQRLFDRARARMRMPTVWSSFLPSSLSSDFWRADERNTAARHHAFFHRRTRGVQGVFDASLLFLHLDLGGSAHR